MNIIKKVKKIVLGLITFLIGLIGSQWSEFKTKEKSLVKFNISDQTIIKQSTEDITVDNFNDRNRTDEAGGAQMARTIFQSDSSIVSGLSGSISIASAGIIITPNLEDYHRSTALPSENIWGIYVEESKKNLKENS